MSGRWMIALILGLLTGSPIVSAQRSAQALNYNVREGKHDVGGFGAGFLLGAMVAGDMYRAQVVSDIGGGGRLGDGTPLTRNETVAGISFEYQMGTDSDIAGTNLALDLVSHAVEITDPDPTGFGTISKTATIAKFGFDWVFNFYKSEFVERDGRRSRSNFNLSMLLGIDLGFFLGDFDSLNGLSTVGFD
ncbi:MAG: hypothetical protein L6Q71_07020, partial [Planctomycetes bacterium]|nr:hypothetical protein [Planctomycetota bacterium]